MIDILGTFAGKPKIMLLKDFFQRFPDESSCASYFRDVRLDVGITCPKCGCTDHKWLEGRKSFQCNKCGNLTTLTQGTVMEKSHLPLYFWFFTAHLMTSFKQVISAKEIQHQLEMKYYSPAWLMMMKYRDIMGQREATYSMSDEVELDVSFFPTSTTVEENGKKEIVAQKTKVLVLAESKEADSILLQYLNNTSDTERFNKASSLSRKAAHSTVKKAVRYIKMFAIPNQLSSTINPIVGQYIDKETRVVTDGGHNLMRIKDLVREHSAYLETEGGPHEVVTKVLPWVHIVTGECRSGIEAIHRNIDERFLQLYLNEYCWKFNRRFFRDSKEQKYDLFDHLIRIAAIYTSNIKWRDYDDVESFING
jgi:hypothetical protein